MLRLPVDAVAMLHPPPDAVAICDDLSGYYQGRKAYTLREQK